MTREEAIGIFQMMQANWQFLDFSNQTVAEVWMAAFRPYMEAEVRQGVKDAIAHVSKTPTVADILEYVRAVHEGTRRAREEEHRNQSQSETVKCKECNDYGYINIIYPTGYEAVRPCRCKAAERSFGKKAIEYCASEMPRWKQEMLFGATEIPGMYKLVRVSRELLPTGQKIKSRDGTEIPVKRFGYVPFFPRMEREEVYLQWQKKRT